MKSLRHSLGVITLLLFLHINLTAQTTSPPTISATFTNVPVDSVLISLAKQCNCTFYYQPSQLDSSQLNIAFTKLSLQEALEKLLHPLQLHFSIDKTGNVFITKGVTVKTALPSWFYNDFQPPFSFTDSSIQPVTASDNLAGKLQIIGQKKESDSHHPITIAGYIRDITGEPVIGASLQVLNKNLQTTTDQSGYYTLTVPEGKNTLEVQSLGMEDNRIELLVQSDGRMDIQMQTKITTLKNVLVSAQKSANVRSTQLGVQKLDIKTIKQVPVVFGEADVLRVLTTTPGVKTVGEASTGLNVRGGSADQNLILFNDANIYNPAHFFGMFSAFNPEVVKDVELFKGSIPARYGGRLSSVVNITSREGNKKQLAGSAGVGLITSRLQLEGPIVKDKASFIVAGRTTYANWLMNALPAEYKNSKASFYDINAILHAEINSKNVISFTAYASRDLFNLNSDTFYHYQNRNIALKWKHNFNTKTYAQLTAGQDYYGYSIYSDKNPVNGYEMSFSITQTYLRYHINHHINTQHTLEWGFNGNYHTLRSGDYQPKGNTSLVTPLTMPAEQAIEAALYLSDNFKITDGLTLDAGLRYSFYGYLGPYTVNNYAPGIPRREDNITGTTTYGRNQLINTYHGPEIRVGLRQLLSPTLSVKAGYSSMRQYIHMLSNTAAMAPTDIWKLSDPNIKPQFGEQLSIGLYKNLSSNTIEVSVEAYYKRIRDYLDFKSGATLVLNPHVETDVLSTQGKAYGIELLIKKTTGKLNGWVSYTYSRILLKSDDNTQGEIINNGQYYPANYDKPHDATLVSNYRFSHRFSISLNVTYSTGRPITLPIGRFYYANGMRTLYADRNGHRIPDYFRSDLSMNIEGNHKLKQKVHTSWTIGVYNVTGRRNPYSVYYVAQNGIINGYKLSIFGSIIPFINFNLKF